jgi:DNA-binding MarR family transcriptional regulator
MPEAEGFVTTLRSWMEVFMQRSMGDFMTYARQNGLSAAQLGALFQVRRGSSGVSDLGDDLGVSSSAASQMLERLVQQGLIVRSEDPDDRRVKQIALTERGTALLDGSIRAREGWLSELAETLSDREAQELIAALRLLIDKAKALSRPSAPR